TGREQHSPAGLHADLHRRVPVDRVDGGRGLDRHRDGPTLPAELPQSCHARLRPVAREGSVMTLRAPIFAVLFSAAAAPAFAQPAVPPAPRRITLREAVDLALVNNHAVRLSRLAVNEKDHAKEVAKSAYFPQVRNDTNLVHVSDTQLIEIPSGGLGV